CGSGKLAEADVRSMLGSVELSFIYRLLEALAESDAAGLLAVVAHMAEHAPDFEGSLDELISMLHRVAVAQVVPAAVDNSWGDAERVAQLAGAMTAEDTQLFYQIALNGKRDIALAADPRSGFEMILLRMVAFRPAAVVDETLAPGDLVPAGTAPAKTVAREVDGPAKKPVSAPAASQPVPGAPAGQPPPVEPAKQVHTRQQPVAAQVVRPGPDAVVTTGTAPGPRGTAGRVGDLDSLGPDNWHQVLEQLGLGGIVYTIALHCELRGRDGDALQLVLDSDNAALFNKGHTGQIRAALEKYFNRALSLTIEQGQPLAETPARRQERQRQERQQAAVASIEADPLLQQLIARFDGELDRSSITPVDP
ncbi:MAG: DNA polymerase III subunit gamma/tau, partial [Gammaproteobacteria bacterium]|nr:DNA polymerase III subunit gamma/tau [Gammaproteobacteria bacterium]